MSKPLIYPDKPLSAFMELGITGNIKAKVIFMEEKFRPRDTDKGKAGTFYKTAVTLKDASGTIAFDRWAPAADLPFKLHDTIYINEVHSVEDTYNQTWQIKTCSKSVATIVTEEVKKPISQDYNPKTHQKVNMPFNSEAIESAFTFYPELDQAKLRNMHTEEPQGVIRGHIENTVLMKRLITATLRVGDLLERMMKK